MWGVRPTCSPFCGIFNCKVFSLSAQHIWQKNRIGMCNWYKIIPRIQKEHHRENFKKPLDPIDPDRPAGAGRCRYGALLADRRPALENTTTLVIQTIDLGMIVPLSFLSGILLLRCSAWGYLLASVAVMKFLTMGACVSVMGISMVIAGVAASPVELIVFPSLTLLNVVMAGLLFKNIDARQPPNEFRG